MLPTIFGTGGQKFLQYCQQYSEQADKISCNIANNIRNRQTKFPAILPTIFGIGRQKFLQYCQQYSE